MKSIFVVEDDETTQVFLKHCLEKDYNVFFSKDGLNLIEELSQKEVHLLLMDVSLPDITGLELCAQVKSDKRFKHIPVVFLSSKTGSAARSSGYELGAINYIEKPFEIAELKSLVKSILGQSSLSTVVLGDVKIDYVKQEVFLNNKYVRFTPIEYKLFSYLSHNIGRPFSREQLLDIMKSDEDASDRTVDSTISSIRKKLKSKSLKIKSIYAVGYKLLIRQISK